MNKKEYNDEYLRKFKYNLGVTRAWDDRDDTRLIVYDAMKIPDRLIAKRLHRSIRSITNRRNKLRKWKIINYRKESYCERNFRERGRQVGISKVPEVRA